MNRRWKFWEWIAYGGIAVAAIMLAVTTGFREASPPVMLPHFLDTSVWGFTPLALLIVSAVVILARALGWIGKASPEPNAPAEPVPPLGGDVVVHLDYADVTIRSREAGTVLVYAWLINLTARDFVVDGVDMSYWQAVRAACNNN